MAKRNSKPIKGLEEQMEGKPSRQNSRDRKPQVSIDAKYTGSWTKAPNASKTGFNDPSWYAKNEQLLKDAASLAFANFQGMTITDTGNMTGGGMNFKPSSIMAIEYLPTFGTARTAVDAVNIATRNIYSYVRHANSGHTNYEPADLGIYLFAVTELYGFIAWLEHAYGVSRVYSVKNRALPRSLISAMGIDPDNLLENQAQVRFTINRLIQKIASLCIPKGMSLLERRIWMNSFTFKDADTDKASLYVFKPKGYYSYEANHFSNGGCLKFHEFQGNQQIINGYGNDLLSHLEGAIDAVLMDEDMNIMSGDILKAYGDNNLAKLGYLPEDYANIPVYQPEVLSQIHNLVVVAGANNNSPLCTIRSRRLEDPANPGAFYDYSGDYNIVLQQRDGILFSELFIGEEPVGINSNPELVGIGHYDNAGCPNEQGPTVPVGKHLFDLESDSPSAADVMVASRLHPTVTVLSQDESGTYYDYVRIDQMGTEVVTGLGVYVGSDMSPSQVCNFTVYNPVISGGNIDYARCFYWAFVSGQFKLAPIVYFNNNFNTGSGATWAAWNFSFILGDLYNFTAIDEVVLNKTHITAVLSEVSIGTLFADK